MILAMGLAAEPARGAGLDHGLYAKLLESHTAEVRDLALVRVDYRGLRGSPDWKRLLAGLSSADPAALATRSERLAFWINAYNILAIDIVLQNYPVESIRDIGSFLRPVWKRAAGTIAGEPHTLGQIEHDILRPMGEPRVHAAIVCASGSCPPLRREPFEASRLGKQLDDTLRTWLADPRKGSRYEEASGTLYLSSVFDWFGDDFAAGGGVLASITPHLPAATRAALARRSEPPRIRFLDYDWRLNDLASPEARRVR